MNAEDDSSIRSLGLSIAASGSNAIGAIIGANVITNSVTAEVSGSRVASGDKLELIALSDSDIMAFTGGVAASGSTAVLVSLSANVIANSTRAVITDQVNHRSDIDAGGPVEISAKDSSTIDSLAFGVSGSGSTAVGIGLGANVIVNTIESSIAGAEP